LLVLGRVSNLPTVWSNCLAGWTLAGGGPWPRFALLCLGASFVYLGGMYLNDAFDAEFDRQHRRERPIPSGAIDERRVWQLGFAWLILGLLGLAWLGKASAVLAALLVGCVLLYNAVHKLVTLSPLLMGACRSLLYLIAATAAVGGVPGLAVWSALALASYIVGLSYLAMRESTRTSYRVWPLLLLGVPLLLALVVNSGPYRAPGLWLTAVVGLWIVWCLRYTLGRGQPNIGRTVSRLLAGIVLVDLLAVGLPGLAPTLAFVALFAAALLLQRVVPAT
jgi:4-hydroxybenzoate polyprenyltransferase